MLEFGRSLAAGAASASFAYALVLFGTGPLATFGILTGAALALCRTGMNVGAWLIGLALGPILSLRLLSDWGLDGIVTAAIVAGVVAAALDPSASAASRASKASSTDRERESGAGFVATIAAAMSLALVAGSELREVTAICGLDARSIVYGSAPILLIQGFGAIVGGYLWRRHEVLRIALPLTAAVAAAALLLQFTPDANDRLAAIEQIQSPAASRRAWLFGISLAMVLFCGGASVALGVLARCVSLRAAPKRAAVAATIGVVAGATLVSFVPVNLALPATLALSAGALSFPLEARALRALVGASAIILAVVGWWASPPARSTFLLTDRHALYYGEESATIVPPTANGRPSFAPDPPGWPFQSDPLPMAIDLVRAAARTGEILLIGDEGATLAAQSPDPEISIGSREDALRGRDRAAVVFLPSTFSSRFEHFARFSAFTADAIGRLRGDGRFVVIADLAEIDLETFAAVVRAPRDCGLTTRIAIHGRHAIVFADRSSATFEHDQALAALARPPRPTLLLGAQDTGLLATLGASPHHPSHEYLLLGEGRARLPHGIPKQASTNLRRLLRLTRSTRASPVDSRIRLELAAAILEDDYSTEDRLIRLLAHAGADDAPRLLIQRSRARERIVEFLLRDREDHLMANDADLRLRVGRVMRGLGNTLGAIEEFVRVIELRPHLLEAPVALAEVFLDADTKRQTRSVHGHVANGRDMPFQLDVHVIGLEDEALRSRLEVARGISHLRSALESESPRREDLLRQALGRFRLATDLDPAAADATRLYGETLFHLGHVEEAKQRAREAVSIAPLDPRTHALLATVTDDPLEAMRARTEVLRLDP